MPCVHLKELYELCEKHDLRIASPDAIRIVCRQCEEQDVCPSSLTDGEQVLELPPNASPDVDKTPPEGNQRARVDT